jgi:hypothetical protein
MGQAQLDIAKGTDDRLQMGPKFSQFQVTGSRPGHDSHAPSSIGIASAGRTPRPFHPQKGVRY